MVCLSQSFGSSRALHCGCVVSADTLFPLLRDCAPVVCLLSRLLFFSNCRAAFQTSSFPVRLTPAGYCVARAPALKRETLRPGKWPCSLSHLPPPPPAPRERDQAQSPRRRHWRLTGKVSQPGCGESQSPLCSCGSRPALMITAAGPLAALQPCFPKGGLWPQASRSCPALPSPLSRGTGSALGSQPLQQGAVRVETGGDSAFWVFWCS